MSFGSSSNRDDDYIKHFRERFNQIKKSQAPLVNNSSLTSAGKIAEFRKKLEESFNARSEQSSKFIGDESFKSYNNELLPEARKNPLCSKSPEFESVKKNNLERYSFTKKQRIEEIIPLNTLIEAKNALVSAPEEIIKELPHLYALTLSRLSKSFIEKHEKFSLSD